MSDNNPELTRDDYETLARFRFSVRQYLQFAERGAREAGLTSQQHQALLAIKAQSFTEAITVGELARRLLLRPHSTAELVNRLATASLITRMVADPDRRKVSLRLTPKGETVLAGLSARNLEELRTVSPALEVLIGRLASLVDADGDWPDDVSGP